MSHITQLSSTHLCCNSTAQALQLVLQCKKVTWYLLSILYTIISNTMTDVFLIFILAFQCQPHYKSETHLNTFDWCCEWHEMCATIQFPSMKLFCIVSDNEQNKSFCLLCCSYAGWNVLLQPHIQLEVWDTQNTPVKKTNSSGVTGVNVDINHSFMWHLPDQHHMWVSCDDNWTSWYCGSLHVV